MAGTCSKCKRRQDDVRRFLSFQLCHGCWGAAGSAFKKNHPWKTGKKVGG